MISRRQWVQSSMFGFLSLPITPYLGYNGSNATTGDVPHSHFPAIDPDIVAEVVGLSHFNLEKLKTLVDPRPELSKASWDWGYSDVESAIGAASHVGRKDIVEYLVSKGAMPTIFTCAMLGQYETVTTFLTSFPHAHLITGPHGISLLDHAIIGRDTATEKTAASEKLIAYLKALRPDETLPAFDMTKEEKEAYLGDYMYGEGEEDGFTVRINMRGMLSLGRRGKFGGGLIPLGENEFTYNGAPSVRVFFQKEMNTVVSLTLQEPGLTLNALKI